MLCFFFFDVGLLGNDRLPWCGILSVFESQEWFCGLDKRARTSIHIGAAGKWVNFFWVNYPFMIKAIFVCIYYESIDK